MSSQNDEHTPEDNTVVSPDSAESISSSSSVILDPPQSHVDDETHMRPLSKRKIHHTYATTTSTKTAESFEKTRFKDIIGHGAVKLRLDELLLPLALPEKITQTVLVGIRALPASILLYGPPGCGKVSKQQISSFDGISTTALTLILVFLLLQTQLARAIAGEARAAFYTIAPSDIMSKFVGESEAAIRDIFRKAMSQAEQLESKCAVIFWDEIDALGRARRSSSHSQEDGGGGDDCSRRILAELLMELNKLSESVALPSHDNFDEEEDSSSTTSKQCLFPQEDECEQSLRANKEGQNSRSPRLLIVAATNRPEDCDPALLRRFGIRCFVGPPSYKHRRKMLQRALEGVSHTLQSSDFDLLANLTDKWSGCDLQNMAREAAMAPVRECIRAAVLRRKQAAQQETDGSTTQDHPDREAHQMMMEGVQNLRPITLQDFAFAIDFVSMKQDDTQAREFHYDSSSDEEDEDEEVAHEDEVLTEPNSQVL